MRIQWTLILALVFALFTAIFAVFNVNEVRFNYLVGEADVPLILIILGSTLLGGLIIGSFGIVRQYQLQKKIRLLQHEIGESKEIGKGKGIGPAHEPARTEPAQDERSIP
jgi:putative membrane protein